MAFSAWAPLELDEKSLSFQDCSLDPKHSEQFYYSISMSLLIDNS